MSDDGRATARYRLWGGGRSARLWRRCAQGLVLTRRGSHTRHAEGGREGRQTLTQVGRALKQLHVEHIPSYSPQREGGWSVSGTRCRSACSAAQEERDHDDGDGQSLVGGGLYRETQRPFRRGRRGGRDGLHSFVGELDNILCIEEERVAALDNTVRYEGRRLQIPPKRNRHHFAKSTIRVLEYWNGDIALFHGPREIARFHADGTERKVKRQERVCRVSPLRGACGRRGQLRGQTART